MSKLIIFDFDGVLADSFDTFYPLIKAGMRHIGLSMTPEQYRSFFIGNVHQGLKDFINNEGKYHAFLEFRKNNYDKYYYKKANKVKFYKGAAESLKKISKKYILTIASSGKQKNIKKLLKENNVAKLFGLILANSATSKEGMLREILQKFNVKNLEATMITDTVGDVLIAKKLGIKTIAVTWGFQSENNLRFSKPNLLVNSFKELIDNI